MEELNKSQLQCGVAEMPLPGSVESGDRHICKAFPEGALIGVIDGVGHGSQAAVAAAKARAVMESNAAENVIALVGRCHEMLKGTRGAAISLASFSFRDSLLTWLGVGNVQGILLPAGSTWSDREDFLFLRPGLVGSNLPRLEASVVALSPGDTVVLWTDGIEGKFDRTIVRSLPPQKAAGLILAQHARGNDDALILIVRYLGNHP